MPAPFFGSGPFRHTDLGQAGPSEPYFWSLGAGYVGVGGASERPSASGFPLLWSYEVPDGMKMRAQALVVHASHRVVIGATNFIHARRGDVLRSGIISLKVDGAAVFEMEGRGVGQWEQDSSATPIQYTLCADADLQTKIDLHDGVQFTAGQDLTVEADIDDPSHTIEGAWLSVARLRLWGKNTGSGAFVSVEATLRAPFYGNDQLFHWNADEAVTSYEVPAGGFTWMGGALRVEVGDFLMSHNNLVYLNENLIQVIGPLNSASGLTLDPITIPLGGADLYPGDRLELRGSPGPDFGQTISAHLIGSQVALSTYPRSRVGVP